MRKSHFWRYFSIWGIIHLALLLIGLKKFGLAKHQFWPFDSYDLAIYDFSEFLVYLAAPAILYVLYLIIRK